MKNGRILLVHPSHNEACRALTQTLKTALKEWEVTISSARLTTLFFQIRAADIAHFFMPPTKKIARFLKRTGNKTHLIQTILSLPTKPEDYQEVLFGRQIIVFSHQERSMIENQVPGVPVEVIPPPVALPDLTSLQPSAEVRQKYDVGERMLVVALSDVSSKQHFDSFLYICREFNRREGFRFLIPPLKRDKETALWRERLQNSIHQEKLQCVTLLRDSPDLHSLIDSADVAVSLDRRRDDDFSFFLLALEALCSGKPVLSFNVPPLNEILRDLHPQWVIQNTEDVVRITRDIRKDEAKLEQIFTEVARSARNRFGPEKAASRYEELYHRLLTPVEPSSSTVP